MDFKELILGKSAKSESNHINAFWNVPPSGKSLKLLLNPL
jgi:hypothetical protein